MKRSHIKISREALAQILQTPPEATIRSISYDHMRDQVIVFLDGYGPDVPEGSTSLEVNYVIPNPNQPQQLEIET